MLQSTLSQAAAVQPSGYEGTQQTTQNTHGLSQELGPGTLQPKQVCLLYARRGGRHATGHAAVKTQERVFLIAQGAKIFGGGGCDTEVLSPHREGGCLVAFLEGGKTAAANGCAGEGGGPLSPEDQDPAKLHI